MDKRPIHDTLRKMTADGWTISGTVASRLNAILRGAVLNDKQTDFNVALTKALFEKDHWPLVAINFTGDTDVAMLLVPENWHVKIERYSDGWYCEIKPHSKADESYKASQCVTMASAIVHASLTAAGFRSDKTPVNIEATVDA